MQCIVHEPNSANIFLFVSGRWYWYDSSVSPLGEGGMGLVYLGFDYATNERVTVKKLRSELCCIPWIRNRAKLEASIIINHPNLISMIGYCEDNDDSGPLYVLSKFISGITMDVYVRESLSKLSSFARSRKIVEAFLSVIDGVNSLHSKGIVHRDIKPSNIMIQDGYLPVVMDLGVAKADYFFDAHITGTIGSPPYAAPEQIVPDNVEAVVDARSDIYSLGKTLYNLLDLAQSIESSGCSEELLEIIGKATKENPDERYDTVNEFKEDLEAYLKLKDKNENNPKTVFILILAIVAMLALLTIILLLI